MTTTATADGAVQPASSAAGVAWDLGDLYAGLDDPKIDHDLQTALQRARVFEAAYRGKINAPGGPTVDLLAAAMTELETLSEQRDKPLVYASLMHSAKSDDPARGALMSRTQQQAVAVNQYLIFFDLEWVHLQDEVARPLIDAPAIARYRHYLDQKRAWRPHFLSEPEEKIHDEKSITGRAAFGRLFEETVSSIECPIKVGRKTEPLSLQLTLAKLYDPDRKLRKAAAEGLTHGLQKNARLLTFIFNNIVLDHQTDCRLRKFPDPMASRHLANEIKPEVVEALITAAERHQKIVQRYYRLKARLLGVRTLYDYDRYAPLFPDMPTCDWPTGRRIVEESYEAFSPKAGAIVREFFDKHWIDAEPRPGKRTGAFSSSAVPSVHPYILMNYTDKLRDVMTLAHELGHGLHQYLSRPVGYFQCDTPLTTAETASVFGEMLTFRRLQELFPEPRTRLAMLCSKIEDGFATVFRQVVLTRFEQTLHKARQERGELTMEQINELWMAANQPMYGKAVKLTDGYAWWWLYIGHFIRSPFYCYAYAFGELLVLALIEMYRREGEAFVPRYLELLASGGSDTPDALLAKLGVDVTDPGFWELGLKLLGGMVGQAEELAAQLEPSAEETSAPAVDAGAS
ncbi:MAG TPA: M3 family oligoendopeptidase [Gemmataceae bacterium]|nr:M3 family oligoendopeptidase [Gemmataceae bacterium]